MFKGLQRDVLAVFDRDPAAKSWLDKHTAPERRAEMEEAHWFFQI
jgi:hypothetical protein